MKAAVDTLERPSHGFRIGDIPSDELDLPRQVLAAPAREIVENPHRMPVNQQRLYQMRADEPGTAGDEVTSHPISLK